MHCLRKGSLFTFSSGIPPPIFTRALLGKAGNVLWSRQTPFALLSPAFLLPLPLLHVHVQALAGPQAYAPLANMTLQHLLIACICTSPLRKITHIMKGPGTLQAQPCLCKWLSIPLPDLVHTTPGRYNPSAFACAYHGFNYTAMTEGKAWPTLPKHLQASPWRSTLLKSHQIHWH